MPRNAEAQDTVLFAAAYNLAAHHPPKGNAAVAFPTIDRP